MKRLASQRGLAGIIVMLALLIAAVLYLGYFRAQSTTQETKSGVGAIDSSRAFACKTNRQTAERDIQMWLVNHPGESPSIAALEADSIRLPTCPEGGTYSIDGMQVQCTKHQ